MATVLLVIILAVAFFYFISKEVGFAVFYGLVFGTIIGMVFTMALTSGNTEIVEVVEIMPLHNLYDDVRVEGKFFLGSGKISEVDYYFFNVVKENGGYYPHRLRKYSEDITIFEDEQVSPYIEKRCDFRQLRSKSVWVFNSQYDKPALFGCNYDFHIPTDSVDSAYSLR
jgi:hypothetical protein